MLTVLSGCFSKFDLVKGGIVAVGNGLFLVVDNCDNELLINTTTPGAPLPTQKSWKGKAQTDQEIVRYNKLTKEISPLARMELPTPATVIIKFTPKHIKVYESDGTYTVHKRLSPLKN